jgi:DNA-directed RNA polymerase subunit E'/Rpb7
MIVEKIEKKIVKIELANKEFIYIPLEELPEGIKEGDMLRFKIEKEKTNKRRKKIEEKMDKLWE